MVAITEQPIWVDSIRQIEANDPVQGGEGGIDNIPHQQLANRTAYLKQQLDGLTIPTDLSDALAKETKLRKEGDEELTRLIGGISIPSLNNTLDSDSTTEALTAAQGKVLKSMIDARDTSSDYEQTLAVDGYCKLPNGLIMQWGTVNFDTSPGERSHIVTFNKPFQNKCFNFQATRKTNNPSGDNSDGATLIYSISKDQVVVSLQNFNEEFVSGLRGFTWFALGV